MKINSIRSIVFCCLTIISFSFLGSAYAFDIDIHESINDDAFGNIFQQSIHDLIKSKHEKVDELYPRSTQWDSEWHFDDCEFYESSINIQNQYEKTLQFIGEKKYEQAAEEWGKSLHPIQDFYAHSNWIENGKRELLDNTLTRWHTLERFGDEQGLIIIEEDENGNTINGFNSFTVSRYSHIVTTNKGGSYGLISGTAYRTDKCPDEATLGHWDSMYFLGTGNWPTDHPRGFHTHGSGLNKDNPSRDRFEVTKDLAIKQTFHEWCRLVSLVDKEKHNELEDFLKKWTQDPAKAKSMCLSSESALIQLPPIEHIRVPPQPPIENRTDDVSDSNSRQSSNKDQIPFWIRSNAEWWSEGSVEDSSFKEGIQYLIKDNFMRLPSTEKDLSSGVDERIPAWIKSNADWWAHGQISDDDFIKGMQYLVEKGVLKI